MDRRRDLRGDGAHGRQVLRPVRVPFEVVDLKGAEQVVAEPHRIDQDALHVSIGGADARVPGRVADHHRARRGDYLPAERLQLGDQSLAVRAPDSPPVGQGHFGAVPPAYPVVAPVKQAVRQSLDLLEGPVQRRSSR